MDILKPFIKSNTVVNGKTFANPNEVLDYLNSCVGTEVIITLSPENQDTSDSVYTCSTPQSPDDGMYTYAINSGKDVYLCVKPWMTNYDKDSFMVKWNKTPMPMTQMQGKILSQTRGMLKVQLHGKLVSDESTVVCSVCGRVLTNPKSKYIGIGPECASRIGIDFKDIPDDVVLAKDYVNRHMQEVVWEGWICKSAIVEAEYV